MLTDQELVDLFLQATGDDTPLGDAWKLRMFLKNANAGSTLRLSDQDILNEAAICRLGQMRHVRGGADLIAFARAILSRASAATVAEPSDAGLGKLLWDAAKAIQWHLEPNSPDEHEVLMKRLYAESAIRQQLEKGQCEFFVGSEYTDGETGATNSKSREPASPMSTSSVNASAADTSKSAQFESAATVAEPSEVRAALEMSKAHGKHARSNALNEAILDALPDAQSGQRAGVAEGYVLVPVQSTPEMLEQIKFLDDITDRAMTARYKAMLAAAPTQQQEDK